MSDVSNPCTRNPSERPKLLLSWSGGKDCCWVLERLLRDATVDVVGLVTCITLEDRCVSMHGVPERLLQQQAEALGLPLIVVELPRWPDNLTYEARLSAALEPWKDRGVQGIAFGDLYLADIRSYREAFCARLGMTPYFPVWGLDTGELAREFVASGYRAVICCVDTRRLNAAEYLGCRYDTAFLQRLPEGVDPCGEAGEFHTFVVDGPRFRQPVSAEVRQTTGMPPFQVAVLDSVETSSRSS